LPRASRQGTLRRVRARARLWAFASACLLALGAARCAPGAAPPPPTAPRAPAVDEDLDGDGIPDRLDRCPNLAEDCDGFQDADGCPDADNDGDGIPDVCDLCPNEPESRNGVEDADGCPEPTFVAAERADDLVVFAWREAKLTRASSRVLDAVAATLGADPARASRRGAPRAVVAPGSIERLAVVGHAASDEPRKDRLAEERASVVVAALIERGVDPARLEAHGASDRAPRVPENDPAHAQNRRVSFHVARWHGVVVATFDGEVMRPARAAADAGADVCPGGWLARRAPPCPKRR
jgi:outer membrane protein OmpA-like peptidoglycan-associated protein